jgi:DNA-binding GntR family transcriptional regulator
MNELKNALSGNENAASHPPSHPPSHPGTLATSVYDHLRQDILSGDLAPGEKLRSGSLRGRYDVGNSPLREALNRLSVDGFVVREDQKGFSVANVSKRCLEELIRTRCWLEEVALRESIGNRTVEWEEQVVLSFHHLSRTERYLDEKNKTPNAKWSELHRTFHMTLIDRCNSQWMLNFCAQLYDQASRYCQLADEAGFIERDSLKEHRLLMDAAIDGNADEAIRVMLSHYNRTADIILNSDMEFFEA